MDICPRENCTGCGACANACPKSCISWVKDELDTLYPIIDESICIHCDACRRACPNNSEIEFHHPIKTYAAWSLDKEDRRTSASGGITSVFYQYTLNRGGFTCGAELTLEKGVNYISLQSVDDIQRVKNSKYVFSHTNDIYKQVRQALKARRFVFFIGLPCQVAGLKTFLGKLANDENLLTADIICHGVANEDYLFQYLHHIEKKKRIKTEELSFRDPEFGTEMFEFTLRSGDNVFYKQNHYGTNLYYIGYMDELHYRENCYHCHYARTERISDLTFGDFDGLGKDKPFEHWNRQVSMCLVNTQKGERYLKEVAGMLFLEERTLEEAVKPQRQLNAPSKGHPMRGVFVEEYKRTHDFTRSANKVLGKKVRKNRIRKIVNTLVVTPIIRLTTKQQRDRIKKTIKEMSIKENLHNYVYEQLWTLGFIEGPVSDIIEGKPYEIHYVKGMPHDRWFADPFILDYNEQTIQVLVEEYCYKLRRGRIARLSFDRSSYRLLSYKIILDLPTHLSFPFIERKNGKVYISPENSASGCWSKYEYDVETDQLKKVQVIAQQPLTDAIKTDIFGEDLIFSTYIPTQNGSVLTVYDANGEKKQDIGFQTKIARNAGDWFKLGDNVYRPAQDCNGGYGCAVIIQHVCKELNQYSFADVRRIESTNPKFTTGCHTFNNYKELIVVDVHGRRRPRVFSFVKKVKGLIE